jgi:hypothetical protein
MATKYLAPSPRFRATDNNGNPLAGGFLTAYAAGTTTIATTYSDSAGTANSSVITLDAQGECNVWLTPGLKYDFRLTDSAGYLVWTATRVSAPVTPSTYFATLMTQTTQLALFNIIVAPGGTVTGDWNMEAAYNYAVPVEIPASNYVPIGGAASNTVTIGAALAQATWSPSVKNANITLSLGDTTATGGSVANHLAVRATVGKSSGKWFYECGPTIASNPAFIGLSLSALTTTNGAYLGVDATGIGYYEDNGFIYPFGGTPVAFGATWTNTDRMGVLADLDSLQLIFWKNGVQQGAAQSLPAGTYYPACSVYGSPAQGITAIFVDGDSQGAFWTYPPPVGYSGWAS